MSETLVLPDLTFTQAQVSDLRRKGYGPYSVSQNLIDSLIPHGHWAKGREFTKTPSPVLMAAVNPQGLFHLGENRSLYEFLTAMKEYARAFEGLDVEVIAGSSALYANLVIAHWERFQYRLFPPQHYTRTTDVFTCGASGEKRNALIGNLSDHRPDITLAHIDISDYGKRALTAIHIGLLPVVVPKGGI